MDIPSEIPGRPQPRRQLLVLDAPSPGPAAAHFKCSGKAAGLLACLGDPRISVVAVEGKEGIGRSAFIQSILLEHAGSSRELIGAVRIECWPGLRLEELLFKLGEFFSQLGAADLSDVALQRTVLASKLAILLQLIHDLPVLIWLDDFDQLAADPRSSTTEALSRFMRMWRILKQGSGKMIVSYQGSGIQPPEMEHLHHLKLHQEDLVDLEVCWNGMAAPLPAGGTAPAFGAIPAGLREHLLGLKVFHSAAAGLGDPLPEGSSMESMLCALRNGMPLRSRLALDLLSMYRRPMSHGTLRALLQGMEGEGGKGGLDAEELRSLIAGTPLLAAGSGDQRLQLHPAIRRIWDGQARAADDPHWKRCHLEIAKHHLELAVQVHSLWDWYWGYAHLMDAGKAEEAYEVQKSFVEILLCAGFLEISRSILEECLEAVQGPQREVILGNLAIIHKASGDHDSALRLYKEALNQFALRNDLANVARVHHQIGNTYYLAGNHSSALNHYRTSLEIATHMGDSVVALMTRVQIANIQFSRREFGQALETYREALTLAKDSGNPHMELALHIQISQIHMSQNLFPEAAEELQKAEEMARSQDDRRNLLKVMQLRGILAAKSRDYAQALACFGAAIEKAVSLGDLGEQVNSMLHLGSIEEEQLHYAEALRAYLEARDLLAASVARPEGGGGREAGPGDGLPAVQTRLREIAEKIGPEAFSRIAKHLGRDEPFPGD